jgi:hypothetical protein
MMPHRSSLVRIYERYLSAHHSVQALREAKLA